MIPSKQIIVSAHERIKPYIHRTPLHTCSSIDKLAGCSIFFKCENFQKTGAFKARGAMNAALMLSAEARSRGLATHSSGNHAQALARAASLIGVKSYLVMPETSAEIKRKGVLLFGGKIIMCKPTLQARENTLAEIVRQTGATEIHPFNNYEVIAGQATVAKEIFEDLPNLDYLLAPVGGGGLLSGVALARNYFSPTTRIIATEPENADDAFRSMQSGKIEPSQANSIADGLLTALGTKTFPIIKENVEEVITVSDSEIIAALNLVMERMKIVIEPSSAVPLAALLKQKKKFGNKKVGIVISGGNVDLAKIINF
jgi:threonine dehydratase